MEEEQTTEQFGEEEPEDSDECSELILLVESRKFLYDLENPKYKDKHAASAAWKQIASLMGKGLDATWCQKKWKSMRDYYVKKKRTLQISKKSGQARKKSRPWPYFKAMSFLDRCLNENESTISNLDLPCLDELESRHLEEVVGRPGEPNKEMTETPATFSRVDTTIKKPLKKRRLDASFDEVSDKIIKFLDTPEPVPAAEDHFDMFGRSVADRLRKMPPSTAAYLRVTFEKIFYETEFPTQPTYVYNYTEAPLDYNEHNEHNE
ncbi:unnamed protein product, partial [Allacma fusca]